MKLFSVFFLLVLGHAKLHAQEFSITPSVGFGRGFQRFETNNAPSLGKISAITKNGFAYGMALNYSTKKLYAFTLGYNYVSGENGWNINSIQYGRFTPVTQSGGWPIHQFFTGLTRSFNLIFDSKYDKIEKKNGWVYEDGEHWTRLKISTGINLNTMTLPEDYLRNPFLPGTSYNNDNPDFAWMLGYETPRYVHQTSMGLWFRTGLTFVKKGRDKLSLDLVMNIGLQDKYIIATNNKYGNTRTGQLLKEEQFNVVSKGTSMALMLSYPIYFGKKK